MLKHLPDSVLTAGAFDTGGWDTVYSQASVTLTAAGGTWLSFTLDHPFAYNPTQSLGIQMEQCGVTGTYSGYSLTFSTATGNRRNYSIGTCPYVYSGVSTGLINCGIDIASAPTTCSKTANAWCPLATYPSLPAGTYFQESAWIGDTLYVHAPTSAGAVSTTIYKWTYGAASWSTGVPCLTAVVGASLSTCNNKMYLIGGGTSAVTTGGTTVQEYNPATGTWTLKAALPTALAAHGSVCWGDSVIFVVGGPYTGSASNLNVYYYRPASDSWGTLTNSLPSGQGRRTFSLGICGNKIVMSCGYNTAYLKSTYVGTIGANASSLTWAIAPNAQIALSRSAGIGYGNNFYVSGGDTNGTAVKNDKVFIFNTVTNTWVGTILSNPNPISNSMNALTAKCISDTVRLFQPGGYNASSVGTANFVITGCGVVTGISTNPGLPKEYSLSQNYPNPFNPVTKISFDIPKNGFVSVRIYDVLGKEVKTLVNEVKTAGSYIVDFDASSFSSGTYFYRLESNGFVATKKMMLIK
jgi:hypothetical protein